MPGTVEALTSFADASATAAKFGYPVMLKASAGGGGKGMRLVTSAAELRSAFETAQSEAAGAFGDSALYLEKAVERPRHIEIQSLRTLMATLFTSANASVRSSAAIKKWSKNVRRRLMTPACASAWAQRP